MKSIAYIFVLVALVVVTAAYPVEDDSDDSIQTQEIDLDEPEDELWILIGHLENRNELILDQDLKVSSDPYLREQQEAQENSDEANTAILPSHPDTDVEADIRTRSLKKMKLGMRIKLILKGVRKEIKNILKRLKCRIVIVGKAATIECTLKYCIHL